jgi:NAD(P)-dependent dehydrogenase (short-subunit alcohol dehydrogenase family)
VPSAARVASYVSIVVNNAGIALRTPVLDAPLADNRTELETNLFGLIRVARAFAPALAQHRASTMLNVLSALSWPSPGRGYEISKAAASSATNSMRVRLREQGTVVTALHVGYMDTGMIADLDVPKTDPREVARQAVDAIGRGAFEVRADDAARLVKSRLSQDVTALYPELTAA